MSSISVNVPVLQVNNKDLQNFVSFIYKHEQLLKAFGAIKLQLHDDCKLALKKRRKNSVLCPIMKQIVKMTKDDPIYFVQKVDHIDESIEQSSSGKDECSFWSSLSSSSNKRRQINISILPNKSFFHQNTSLLYFDIHRLPKQSLLKLGGSKLTRHFVPYVKRAHGPGAIFPLTSAQQRLFSVDYHHEGGAHHWYIIPTCEREALQKIMDYQNASVCLDHGQLFIDPSVLDKYHIRYNRIIQHPNEFIVLSAGSLAQSFTEDASWSESISFALPSWIEEYNLNFSVPLCQCNISQDSLPESIDITLFAHEPVERYITSYLNIVINDTSLASKGS